MLWRAEVGAGVSVSGFIFESDTATVPFDLTIRVNDGRVLLIVGVVLCTRATYTRGWVIAVYEWLAYRHYYWLLELTIVVRVNSGIEFVRDI